jgi:hypothetical protein
MKRPAKKQSMMIRRGIRSIAVALVQKVFEDFFEAADHSGKRKVFFHAATSRRAKFLPAGWTRSNQAADRAGQSFGLRWRHAETGFTDEVARRRPGD